MNKPRWTRERVLELIKLQIPYLQKNKFVTGKNAVWFGKSKDWNAHWVRAHIESTQLIAAYASEHPEPELIRDVEQALEAFCRSHKTETADPITWPGIWGFQWGYEWQSAWWTYRAVRCVHELGDKLSQEIRAKVLRVVEFEADRFIGVRPPSGVRFDTKMEENSWDAPLLAWASFVFPQHTNAAVWEKTARLWAFNAVTTERDRTNMRLLEDKPIAKWYSGPCLHPDYTCENHGTFHPNYQACIMQNGITASAYELHGQPVPPSILYNMREVTDILTYFLAPDTTQLMVTGNDWPTFHGIHSCMPILAHYTGDPHLVALAEANLDRAEQLLKKSENGHIFSTTLGADVGNWEFPFHTSNTNMLCDVARIVPLNQHLAPHVKPPTGARLWPFVEVITDRDEHRLAAASWRTLFGHPIFTFLPMADTSWASWAPWTGIGRLQLAGEAKLTPQVFTHEEHITDNRFHTTGVVHWVDKKGAVLIRQEIECSTKHDSSFHFSEKLTAEAEVDLAVNEGFYISISNDLFNDSLRVILTQHMSRHEAKALTGKVERTNLGTEAMLDSKVAARSNRTLMYHSPGARLKEDNHYLANQFDRLLYEGRTGKFHAGEEIRSGTIELRTAPKL